MYLVYSALLAAWLLLGMPYWLWQMLRHGKYRAGLSERLGSVPERLKKSAGPAIWVHAVSVGEVLAVSGLVGELKKRWPSYRIVFSTTTATGQKLAREKFGAENVFYFPLDFAFAIRAYLKALKPELVIVAETEFWPNFFRLAAASGARLAVVNARISDRSLPGYRRIRALLHSTLEQVAVFLAQSEEDRRRLIEIGARAERVQVGGNLKFDVKPLQRSPFVEELTARLQGAFPVLVCGSTMEGEEFSLLGCFQILLQKYPQAVMILAPRHPERFQSVAVLVSNLHLKLWRRSQLRRDEDLRGGVLLLDTIGELAATYSVATLAVVGGSLAPHGGHNILEPALFGVPILVGPHTENFRDIVALFLAADAVRVVRAFREGEEKGNLTKTILDLLENSADREALGRRAAEVLRQQTGATERTLRALQPLLHSTAVPEPAGARAR